MSAWYNEPGIKFNVSHKIYKLIRLQLIEKVMDPTGLTAKDPDHFLNLNTTTAYDIYELAVRGPVIDKRNKFISYGLWLPYKEINDSKEYLKTFLEFYFDALLILFDKYNVPREFILDVREVVVKEVDNNTEYFYVE